MVQSDIFEGNLRGWFLTDLDTVHVNDVVPCARVALSSGLVRLWAASHPARLADLEQPDPRRIFCGLCKATAKWRRGDVCVTSEQHARDVREHRVPEPRNWLGSVGDAARRGLTTPRWAAAAGVQANHLGRRCDGSSNPTRWCDGSYSGRRASPPPLVIVGSRPTTAGDVTLGSITAVKLADSTIAWRIEKTTAYSIFADTDAGVVIVGVVCPYPCSYRNATTIRGYSLVDGGLLWERTSTTGPVHTATQQHTLLTRPHRAPPPTR